MAKKSIILLLSLVLCLPLAACGDSGSQPSAELTPTPVETTEPTPPETEEVILKPTDEGFKLLHGDLVNATADDDGLLIIKAKITSSFSNSATVNQNYYSIQDIIKNHSGTEYSEIQYWAVADMTSGDEAKVISFTVNADTIDKIAKDEILVANYGEYLTDLWIHPSLLA